MPATQQTFDRQLRDAKHRPTVDMGGAKHLLDLNEDYVLDLCLDQTLSHSWNIGLGEDRREVRILRASIDHYIHHGSAPCPLTDDQVIRLLLPPLYSRDPERPLTNPELQRSLNCVSEHVLNLIRARHLHLQPRTSYHAGSNGSALVTFASFKRFLTSRRLP